MATFEFNVVDTDSGEVIGSLSVLSDIYETNAVEGKPNSGGKEYCKFGLAFSINGEEWLVRQQVAYHPEDVQATGGKDAVRSMASAPAKAGNGRRTVR